MTEIDGDWRKNMRQKPVDEYHPQSVNWEIPQSETEVEAQRVEVELGSSPLPEQPASYVDSQGRSWNLGGYRVPQNGCG